MSANLDEVKTFFDPHPGFAGAIIPIPAPVKQKADELDGKTMSLRDAVNSLQNVTCGKVSVMDCWIALKLCEPNGLTHMFRVIRFK